MQKLVVLYPPQPDPAKFKSYYVDVHMPLVRKIPGIKALRWSFDVASPGGDSPYFCVFEGEFADAAAFGAGMGSPEGQAAAGDVPNFAVNAPTMITYSTESSM